MKIIKELREACQALYLEAPEEVCDDLKKRVDAVVAELEKKDFFISCLEAGGVDNWDWYGDSLQDYWEEYDD